MCEHVPWLCSRCVKGEGEIEKLQAKVVELRRKLDDTTAAMQELGRENQSLQVQQRLPETLSTACVRMHSSQMKLGALVVSPCPCCL